LRNLLEIKGVKKRFGATQALSDVSFTVREGGAHAIIGENGAGKSTLIKMLSGIHLADEGQILFDGKEYRPRSKEEARAAGISTAFQELSLLPNLTISENLALPRLTNGLLVSRKKLEEHAVQVLHTYHLSHLSPRDLVGKLNLAEKQKLEIARAFSHRPKLILLDEPTAALPDPEWLFEIIRAEMAKGTTVLYISHRMQEVRELCRYGTVLRNGRSISTFEMDQVSDQEIIQMMVGDNKGVLEDTGRRRAFTATDPGMEVRNLSGGKLRDVSFTLHKGEILGVAGLEGMGQNDLFRILYGLREAKGGTIAIEGRELKLRSPRDALKAGIGFVPEERKTEGIFPGLSTLNNVTASSLKRISSFGMITGKREFGQSAEYTVKVELDPKYLGRDILALSGGNQQKAVMARVMMSDAKYLLVFDPTRGVDVGTKAAFFEMMRAYADEGGSVLWYSTDLSELVHHSDRCLVFYNGRIVYDTGSKRFSEAELLAYATGGQWEGESSA